MSGNVGLLLLPPVPDDRIYPVRRVRDGRLVGIYERDKGWVRFQVTDIGDEPEVPRVIMVQGHPVSVR